MIASAGLFLLASGLYNQASGQTRPVRAVKPVVRPVAPAPGTGVGGANGSVTVGTSNGSGVGTASGASVGGANGSGMGTPSGTVIAVPGSNSAGNSNGSGVGANTAAAARVSTDTPAVPQRTYIKELSGRCYYVTPLGEKHFVDRRQCALYPK